MAGELILKRLVAIETTVDELRKSQAAMRDDVRAMAAAFDGLLDKVAAQTADIVRDHMTRCVLCSSGIQRANGDQQQMGG
jgi:hypothetical protein